MAVGRVEAVSFWMGVQTVMAMSTLRNDNSAMGNI